MSIKRPYIILELLPLQVFCYQTLEDWAKGMMPEQVFWKKKQEPTIHGPFHSIYHATKDYETLTAKEVALEKVELPNNIIMVDFRNKKRIN